MEGRGKGSSCINDLAPRQVSALQWAMPMAPKFWIWGPSVLVARRELPSSWRALGKAPAMQAVQPPLVEMDEELA